ncbi:MAG TPA: hypothetical protein VIA06_04980 [Candidatus Dormibacteraeota bacterium]|jgi:hypothetical protein|nr:hypothetical protein [Candidatus Dormibacteraeota bacterium]
MDAELFLEEIDHLLDLEWAADKSRGRPGRLLPGEDLAAADLENARHWTDVYTELVDFTRRLLNAASASEEVPLLRVMENARDQTLRQHELRRLELHLAFWSERCGRFAPPPYAPRQIPEQSSNA